MPTKITPSPLRLVKQALFACGLFVAAFVLDILLVPSFHLSTTAYLKKLIIPAIPFIAGWIMSRQPIRILKTGILNDVWTSDELVAARSITGSQATTVVIWGLYCLNVITAITLLIGFFSGVYRISAFYLPPIWLTVNELRHLLRPPSPESKTEINDYARLTSDHWGQDVTPN